MELPLHVRATSTFGSHTVQWEINRNSRWKFAFYELCIPCKTGKEHLDVSVGRWNFRCMFEMADKCCGRMTNFCSQLREMNAFSKEATLQICWSLKVLFRLVRHIPGIAESQLIPFMPSGLFYLKSFEKSISYTKGAWLIFIIITFCRNF